MTIRYALLDKVIYIFGFEADVTIEFAKMAEDVFIPYAELKARYLELSNNYHKYIS